MRPSRSLSHCADSSLPAAGAHQSAACQSGAHQPVSVSSCHDCHFTEAVRPRPDRLDAFMHRRTHKHLNNNEVSFHLHHRGTNGY